MTSRTIATAIALAAALVSGCAYNRTSSDYRGYEVMGEQSVRFGVVETVRDVRISPRNTGVGATSGAFIGGIAGSHVGGGSGEIVGAIAGTVLGSIIGYNAEQQANEVPGVEVTVLLDSGSYIAIVQQAGEPFRAGDRVRVLSGRDAIRVTH
jgi:outer membrane lipoprotein SlyB